MAAYYANAYGKYLGGMAGDLLDTPRSYKFIALCAIPTGGFCPLAGIKLSRSGSTEYWWSTDGVPALC